MKKMILCALFSTFTLGACGSVTEVAPDANAETQPDATVTARPDPVGPGSCRRRNGSPSWATTTSTPWASNASGPTSSNAVDDTQRLQVSQATYRAWSSPGPSWSWAQTPRDGPSEIG